MDVSALAKQGILDAILDTMQWFQANTGFTINFSKSKILRIGALRDTDFKLITQREMAWTNEPINVLGIWVTDKPELIELNYGQLLPKIKSILTRWSSRGLSLVGKIQIINSLIGSLFVYKMSTLPNLPDHWIRQIEAEFSKFIWNHNRPKISLKSLQADNLVGGLRLVDLKNKERSLKAAWVKIISEDEKLNTFWSDVLTAWSHYNFNEDSKVDMIIWYNSLIKIEGKPFLWLKPMNKGLFRISQLFCGVKPISIDEAKSEFGLNYLEFFAILSALPKDTRLHIGTGETLKIQLSKYAKALDIENLSSKVYSVLIRENSPIDKLLRKWKDKFLSLSVTSHELEKAFNIIKKTTNVPRLRSFQYRILHLALVLNAHLYRWGMRNDPICDSCKLEKENIQHLYGQCQAVKSFFVEVKILSQNYVNEIGQWTILNVLLGSVFSKPESVGNLIVLKAKQYVYKSRCLGNKLCINEFRGEIRSLENMEKFIAAKNNKLVKHLNKWSKMSADNSGEYAEYVREYLCNVRIT